MTAKEKRQFRRMEIRIEELEKRLESSATVYRDLLIETVDRSSAMREVYEGLLEIIYTLNRVMRNDTAFMHQFGKKQIEADF